MASDTDADTANDTPTLHSIYIASAEGDTGKSTVALGLLALLTATGTALFLFGEAYNLRSAWMSAVAPFWTSIVGALWLFRRDPGRTTTTADAAPAAPEVVSTVPLVMRWMPTKGSPSRITTSPAA